MRATIDIFLSGAQYRKCLKGALAPIQRRYRLMRLEIEILFYLMDATEANNRLRDIVRLEGFNKGQVSRAVSRLEEMGIVSRRLDAQDSRVQHIDILPGNEALLRDVAQAYRGVNGIEGSLSTAAGFSCVTEEKVFCVIGDLSFFYDQNALWNQNLKGNFRILLLNNGKGGIFNMLPGLEQSPARDKFVAAEHHTSAEGICQQNHVVYLKATNMEEVQKGIDTLLFIESDRPVLLEVFTDAAQDEQAFRKYYEKQG